MTSPTPQQLAHSGTLEDLYKQLEPIRHGRRLGEADAVAMGGAEKVICAVRLELCPGQGRARRRRPADQHRTRRAAQPDHAESGWWQLRHLAHHRRGLSDDHAGREGALASPYAERAAADHRRRARRLYHRQRRAARDDAGRRGAYAKLVLARPRQRGAAPAPIWLDVLDVPLVQLLEPMFFESHPDEFEKEIRGAERFADAFLLGRYASAGWPRRRRIRTVSRPRSRSAIPRSTPWRCR